MITNKSDMPKSSHMYYINKNIAKNCCISPVTANTAIKNLSNNGYIDIAHRYDGNGQLSNLYTVLKI